MSARSAAPGPRRLGEGRQADRRGSRPRRAASPAGGALSTGQRRRSDSPWPAQRPVILFLDEPTLGLDVSAARAVRELITGWQAAVPGRTVLLTTHYLAASRRAVRADRDRRRPRPRPRDRHAGRARATGPARIRNFRIELDRLDGGPASLARVPGVVSATAATAGAGGGATRSPQDRRGRSRPGGRRSAGRRGGARRARLADPRPAQVRADAGGGLRRARRARLPRR